MAYIHTKGRWIRVCCPVGVYMGRRSEQNGIPTYQGALDSGMLPCRICTGRRSEGKGIHTYEGALDSGMLPCGGIHGSHIRGGGYTYIAAKNIGARHTSTSPGP